MDDPKTLADYFDDTLRVPPFLLDRNYGIREKSVRKGMERMKVYKTLSKWRSQYSVMWDHKAEQNSCAVLGASFK